MGHSRQIFLFSLVIFLCSSVLAEEMEYKNMEQMMGSIRLEKKQVESMLEKMVVTGRISPEEGQKARRALASIKEDDLENIKTQAMAEVKNKRLLDH